MISCTKYTAWSSPQTIAETIAATVSATIAPSEWAIKWQSKPSAADPIWNDGALGFLKTVAQSTRRTRWVAIWDQQLVIQKHWRCVLCPMFWSRRVTTRFSRRGVTALQTLGVLLFPYSSLLPPSCLSHPLPFPLPFNPARTSGGVSVPPAGVDGAPLPNAFRCI